MKLTHVAASLSAFALIVGTPAVAQTTMQTKVDHDTSMKNGVTTQKTKVTRTTKRKTHRPKKILGVKVGHKTAVSKTVRETKTSSDGDASTTVKTSH